MMFTLSDLWEHFVSRFWKEAKRSEKMFGSCKLQKKENYCFWTMPAVLPGKVISWLKISHVNVQAFKFSIVE